MFNLHFKQFKSLENSNNGEVGDETLFDYFQDGDEIWAEYSGGEIKKGTLEGIKTAKNGFEIKYQHINQDGEEKAGICKTQVSFSKEGKVILDEIWQWTTGDQSKGTSTLIEV